MLCFDIRVSVELAMALKEKTWLLSHDARLVTSNGGKSAKAFEYKQGQKLLLLGSQTITQFIAFMCDQAPKLTIKTVSAGAALAPFPFLGGQLRKNKVFYSEFYFYIKKIDCFRRYPKTA